MSAKGSTRSPVTFHDVAVYFSEEEWEFLEDWRKELYKSVMCEIHGVLISMGYAIVNPDTLFRIKKEEKPFVSNIPACKKTESFQGHTSGSSVVCPDILLRIKQEDNPVIYNPPPCKKRENIINPAPHHPAETSIISVHIKEEEDPYMSEPQHSDRSESFSSPTTSSPIVTSVFSLNNKPVDSSYSRGRQDLGKGFLDIPPEDECTLGKESISEDDETELKLTMKTEGNVIEDDTVTSAVGSMNRKERNTEDYFDTDKSHKEVAESATDTLADSIARRSYCAREQKLRQQPGAMPMHIPEQLRHWDRGPAVQQVSHNVQQHSTYVDASKARFAPQGKRMYQCTECEKRFWKLYCYKVHLRIHTGEKPYTCPECGKRFSQSSHLIRHRRIHTGETPYTCNQCGKSYRNKFNRDKHQRMHAYF